MRIPENIKIYGILYSIELVEDKDCRGNQGSCWTKNSYIKINKTLQQDVQEEALIHEIIHIIVDINNLNDMPITEQVVSTIGAAVHQVLTDNNLFN